MNTLPQHIAIVMDGNGRWAKKRKLPRIAGHRKGVESVNTITEECARIGIRALTLYTFSSENWSRPKKEVNALMLLFEKSIKNYAKKVSENNIRFNAIGQIEKLSPSLKNALEDMKKKASSNSGMILTLAINYGGRQEILDAVKAVCKKRKKNISLIKEKDFEKFLYTKDLPGLDLVIRTSGEMRLSNFLLWQSAYAEFYVTDILWPDFGPDDLKKALNEYQKRERRFGG